MRAYLFWHSRRDESPRSEYERVLGLFHDALAQSPPSGFIASRYFHLPGLPWLGGAEGYEDWYLLDDSAALDPLDAGAVSGDLEDPHHSVARLAVAGIGGLYKPVTESLAGIDAPSALWFQKPAGMSYTSMMNRLETQSPGIGDRLWQRMLVLGPTPEFCLLGSGPDSLPYGWESTLLVRRPLRS